ncbi:phosphatidylserine decarboxylase [Streptomyces palmae]|uniref:Phosphatidylserine decarboxylase n=2 Tax=Streptomyces palmae TaxID=1701085 RepID=A0A4Z0H917_9ACTN|nr:phosphatidylserine decarboxylase [Streptomyces palmae]
MIHGVYEGLDYIEKFGWIGYLNDPGLTFMTGGAGREMFTDFTNLQGMQMDDPKSRSLVRQWIDELGPKRMADYREGDWSTFNKFFIRELAPGARPIDGRLDPGVVVAPTDCVIRMIVDELTEDTPIPVKMVAMNVRQLLDGSEFAECFTRGKPSNPGGGTAVSCVLMPDSYHRYHAPVGGQVVEARDDIGGVDDEGNDHSGPLDNGNDGRGRRPHRVYPDFRRGYVIIKTPYVNHRAEPDGEGYVGLVALGLESISSVRFLDKFRKVTREAPVEVRKGEEIGFFQYGGSLNILLFEKGRFPALQLLMGQRIGVLEEPRRSRALFENTRRARTLRARPVSDADAEAGSGDG